ncbi:HDOD domain-containing protein [uncultured Desulfuromonas sp.]|uniref:HDOD domain-containing protein n=1 Tax=uncultured Desulfuromonas sp. TaxID=181013 RepID=UPI002AAB3616|nr:HDOD domain-containing protein [uncultured Desulfuromonas sp.]
MSMTPEEIIKDINQLVSLPEVVIRANQLLDSPTADAEEIGEVINHDPALSAQLLKLVNSAFYHLPTKAETVSRAITVVGLNELRSLIFAATATETFQDLSPESMDMNAFWHRSVYCGLIAKKLSMALLGGSGETMFLTGLLHDIGRLILYSQLPKQAQQIVSEAEKSQSSLAAIEEKVLGFSSAQLGSALLESWELPQRLWEPIRFQTSPKNADDFQEEATLLKVARQITNCVEPELKSGQPVQLASLSKIAIHGLEIPRAQLELLISDASVECFDVLAIVNPNAGMIF